MRRVATIIITIAAIFSVSACASKRAEMADFFAMDTFMSITAYGKNAKNAVEKAERVITAMSEQLNVADEASPLSQYNTGTSDFWSKEMDSLEVAARRAAELTDGAFDVNIYPVVAAWGFLSGDYRIPEPQELEALLADKSMYDFGGIAKGFASDEAADIMRANDIKSALIALGGNIYAIGNNINGKPWRIAVQDPFDMSGYVGILNLTDEAAVTSGAYQRFFEQDGVTYHHIIDPRTGYPAESGLASVTVVSKNGALADSLSTGLFVLGKVGALEIWDKNRELFDLVLVEDGGETTITTGLRGRFESECDFTVFGS